MTLTGHARARGLLEESLPRVTLIYGPSGVGKTVLAEHVISHHGFTAPDIIRIAALDAHTARLVVQGALYASPGRNVIILIQLDGASDQAQNILLKVLEEPPPPVRFLLVASRPPLPTILSRAHVIPCGLLGEDEVAEVLAQLGVDVKYAVAGRGTVSGALAAARKDADDEKRVQQGVAAAIRAVSPGQDPEALTRALRTWPPAYGRMLLRWSVEAYTGRWKEFTPEFAPGFTPEQAMEVWRLLRHAPASASRASVALRTAARRAL